MRLLIFLRLSLFWGCIILPKYFFAQIHYTQTFSEDSVVLIQNTINGTPFTIVQYEGLQNEGNVGGPSLPVKYLTFSLPYNSYNITVTSTVNHSSTISLSSKIYPEQEPRSTNNLSDVMFTEPNDSLYNSANIISSIVKEGYLDGDNHMVTIAVYPITYCDESSQLRINTTIDIVISYSLASNLSNLPVRPILKRTETSRYSGFALAQQIVMNPHQIQSNTAPLLLTPMSSDTTSGYEYCVITNREFAPAFNRLISYKRQKGFNAGIVCIEDILANPLFQDGDVVSGINDDAGKLRAYLMYAYQNCNTRYVLMGGKEQQAPYRRAYTSYNRLNPDQDNLNVPTDMYFCDLNGNWDVDHDGKYGEPKDDNVDFFCELGVGRLLCDSINEIENYIDKLIVYELNPGKGDFSYLQNAFVSYSYSMNNDPIFNYRLYDPDSVQIESVITSVFPEYHKITQNSYTPTGADVIDKINEIHPFYISLHGHGHPGGVQVADTKSSYTELTNIFAYGVDAIDEEDTYHASELNNGLNNLSDTNYPGIMYCMACTTMPYDVYADDAKISALSANFGASYTLGEKYGGVAFLGNTRVGYFVSSATLEKLFLTELLKGNTIISQAENLSKLEMTKSHHVCLSHNLLGDPALDVWTDIPLCLPETSFEVFRDAGDVICISLSGIDSCNVAILQPNGMVQSQVVGNGGDNFSVSSNSSVMFYKHNMIPYFAPLVVQNQTYEISQNLFASSVKMGKFVDSIRSNGEVKFINGVNFSIDADKDVFLADGVIVKSGATLIISSDTKVTLDGINVESGGTLIVKSPQIIIGQATQFGVNSTIDLKYENLNILPL